MQALLIDLDGVLYVGNSAVPGAGSAIDWLQASGLPHLYLTNTTSRPRDAIIEKLARLGFHTGIEHILTPAVAAAGWLETAHHNRIALFVPRVTEAEFTGFEIVGRDEQEPVDAVVIGDLGEAWDFATLNGAFRMLMLEPQPTLVALGMTRYWRAPDGLRLDTAPFVMALAHASNLEPQVLGKPARAFFATACEMLSIPPDQTVMLGDDIRTDVRGAQDCGIQGVLVRTGKFQETDLAGTIRPDAVLGSIADLPQWWAETIRSE